MVTPKRSSPPRFRSSRANSNVCARRRHDAAEQPMTAGHAVISGGSSGIGLALARRLASSGWDLTIMARDPRRLVAAESELTALRRNPVQRISSQSLDVADNDAVEAAVAALLAAIGPPTLVIASAGMVPPGRFDELPLVAFERAMAVNYFGTLHLVRAVLPAMRRHGGGRIVMVASGAALIGFYGYTAYAPSKFAVRGLAEALRSELAPDGIGISIVYPPDTDTPMLRDELTSRPAITSRLAGGARVLSADAVAAAILDGLSRKRFAIAPGWEMAGLGLLHSLIGPLLHRWWFDPLIARAHRRAHDKKRSAGPHAA
jgi:3-dehydrosphinganine reductase